MEIHVSKKDIYWTYAAQLFGLGAGFITLPLILNRLSAEEVGMNYLMLTISSIANLFDLGFVVQFGRNITYVLSGSTSLQKEGVCTSTSADVNYRLLANVIDTAKYVYRILSLLVFTGLLTFGSLYMYNVTEGFEAVPYSLPIWLLFCLSIFFNIYFKYLESLLNGAAMIKESRKAMVYSRVTYIAVAYALLLMNFGLISVVIANLISPFVSRAYCYHCFYTEETKSILSQFHSTKEEIKATFNTIWNTTKMLGLNMLGSFASNQAGMFIAGLFLSLPELASYGLMTQLFNILSGLSININTAFQPLFCKNRVTGNYAQIKKDLSLSVVVAFFVKLLGALAIIFVAPMALNLIRSEAVLPVTIVMALYATYSLMHDNLVCFCTYITSGNRVPFVKPSLITAAFIIVITFVSLAMGMGLYGPVISVLLVELSYNAWKWPLYVIRHLGMTVTSFYALGYDEMIKKISR